MAFFAGLAVFGVFLGVAYAAFLPRATFVIKIKDGSVVMRKGKVSAAFVDDCLRLCRENNISGATITGVDQRGRVRLKFSRQVPEKTRQRFRNAWTFYT